MNSDLFQEKLNERQAQQNKALADAIAGKQARIALKALDKLEHIIEDDGTDDAPFSRAGEE